MAGHSYLLYGGAKRNVARDGVLLIGDAAGFGVFSERRTNLAMGYLRCRTPNPTAIMTV